MQLVNLPKPLRKGIDRRLPRHASFKNLGGKKYGSRTVLGFAGFRGAHAVWLCRCKCGRRSVVEGAFLRAGLSGSCGCILRLSPAAKKLEDVYHSIKQRCYDPNCESYQLYGARCIAVCKRWRESIEAFAKDMGPRPSPKHVVVRRNKRGNYTPSNCYWATMADIQTRRHRRITYNGRTQSMARWAAELGISREAMRLRVNRCLELGLDLSEAIVVTPKIGRPKKR